MSHCEQGPERCAECWWSGRGEKPLDQCIEGLLRFAAPSWMVRRLAARARLLEAKARPAKSLEKPAATC